MYKQFTTGMYYELLVTHLLQVFVLFENTQMQIRQL